MHIFVAFQFPVCQGALQVDSKKRVIRFCACCRRQVCWVFDVMGMKLMVAFHVDYGWCWIECFASYCLIILQVLLCLGCFSCICCDLAGRAEEGGLICSFTLSSLIQTHGEDVSHCNEPCTRVESTQWLQQKKTFLLLWSVWLLVLRYGCCYCHFVLHELFANRLLTRI